jgi:hypothetical protein
MVKEILFDSQRIFHSQMEEVSLPQTLMEMAYEDLFIGNRSLPGGYGLSPTSAIVASAPESNSYFEAVAQAPLGMVTDSEFADINGDGHLDIVVVGDFMPVTVLINDGAGSFTNQTTAFGLMRLLVFGIPSKLPTSMVMEN